MSQEKAVPSLSVNIVLIRWLRRMQGLGGLLVAVCFFLPGFRPYRAFNHPYEFVSECIVRLFHRTPPDWPGRATLILENVVPCLFYPAGLNFAIIGVLPITADCLDSRKWHRLLFMYVIGWMVGIIALVGYLVINMINPIDSAGFLASVLAPVVLVLVYCNALRRHRDPPILIRWVAGMCMVGWCVLFALRTSYGLYGLYLPVAGSLTIVVSCTHEAKHRSWLPDGEFGDALMLARLPLADDGLPRCVGCGYLLIGLESARCPECGRAFCVEPGAVTEGESRDQ